MIRRLTETAVETDALPRALRVFLLLTAISVALGVVAAGISFADRNYEHISALFPELRHLDSVYIESRGFPCAQWATNDPGQSGVGTARSAFLPSGTLANIALFSILAFFVVTPIWLLGRLITYLRRRYYGSALNVNTRNA